jgi:hypothetical protein
MANNEVITMDIKPHRIPAFFSAGSSSTKPEMNVTKEMIADSPATSGQLKPLIIHADSKPRKLESSQNEACAHAMEAKTQFAHRNFFMTF